MEKLVGNEIKLETKQVGLRHKVSPSVLFYESNLERHRPWCQIHFEDEGRDCSLK